jgi:hypothetical protein
MFKADRFAPNEDYSVVYHELGGMMINDQVNQLIRAAHDYLDVRYLDPQYQEDFPCLQEAFTTVAGMNHFQ